MGNAFSENFFQSSIPCLRTIQYFWYKCHTNIVNAENCMWWVCVRSLGQKLIDIINYFSVQRNCPCIDLIQELIATPKNRGQRSRIMYSKYSLQRLDPYSDVFEHITRCSTSIPFEYHLINLSVALTHFELTHPIFIYHHNCNLNFILFCYWV